MQNIDTGLHWQTVTNPLGTYNVPLSEHKQNRSIQLQSVKWATTWQNQQSDCAPSEDSDQSLRCPHEENLGC